MYVVNKNELYHHGVKGQKWGVRRYQNKDGSRISSGQKHRSKHNKTANSIAKLASLDSPKVKKAASAGRSIAKTHRDTIVNDVNIKSGKQAALQAQLSNQRALEQRMFQQSVDAHNQATLQAVDAHNQMVQQSIMTQNQMMMNMMFM